MLLFGRLVDVDFGRWLSGLRLDDGREHRGRDAGCHKQTNDSASGWLHFYPRPKFRDLVREWQQLKEIVPNSDSAVLHIASAPFAHFLPARLLAFGTWP